MKTRFHFSVVAAALTLVGAPSGAQESREHAAYRVAEGHNSERSARRAAAGGPRSLREYRAKDHIEVDDVGQGHVRYQQFHRGVPVFEGENIVHVDLSRETVVGETDASRDFDDLDVRPSLSRSRARDLAIAAAGLPAGIPSSVELAIVTTGRVPTLAWRVQSVSHDGGEPIDRITFVSASNGRVLRSWDNLQTAAAVGTGNSFFNGAVALVTDKTAATTYVLRDPSRGNQYTVDMNDRTGGSPAQFTDADNTWGNFALSSRQTVAVDAQYGTAVTWDYYKLVHGRNGIANNGAGAYNRVHYGRRYNNAFWSDSCFCMTYGDGDGTTFNPFDSLDVAGHEMTHGVTSRTANLTYSGESGGLNEGTSDIFGTMVEYYAANPNDPGDYLIGERLYKSGSRALRSMIKPSADGVSADCWYPTVGNLDVHYSSGVANHVFHLMAEGTSMGSPTCVAGNTRVASGAGALTGIGKADAARIWYRALTVYMTPSTNYAAARVATLKAATDLFGASSAQYARVAAAWSAVLVN